MNTRDVPSNGVRVADVRAGREERLRDGAGHLERHAACGGEHERRGATGDEDVESLSRSVPRKVQDRISRHHAALVRKRMRGAKYSHAPIVPGSGRVVGEDDERGAERGTPGLQEPVHHSPGRLCRARWRRTTTGGRPREVPAPRRIEGPPSETTERARGALAGSSGRPVERIDRVRPDDLVPRQRDREKERPVGGIAHRAPSERSIAIANAAVQPNPRTARTGEDGELEREASL